MCRSRNGWILIEDNVHVALCNTPPYFGKGRADLVVNVVLDCGSNLAKNEISMNTFTYFDVNKFTSMLFPVI
jgi:hypothetical protein